MVKSVRVKTNADKNSMIILNVRTFVEVELQAQPNYLRLFPKTPNEKIEQEISLTNHTEKAIEIKEITPNSDHVQIDSKIKRIEPHQTEKFRVYLREGIPEGRFNGVITVKTDVESISKRIRYYVNIPKKEEQKK